MEAWKEGGEPEAAEGPHLVDRITLRPLALNLSALVFLFGVLPQASFAALSTRGDWFLDGVDAGPADQARAALLRAADGMSWLYELARHNPHAIEEEDDGRPEPEPTPNEGLARGTGTDRALWSL